MGDADPGMLDVHRRAGAPVSAQGRPLQYGPLGAAYRAAHDAAVVADRGQCGVVDLVGADVRRFANGMFTQNFRDAPVGHVVESGWCDDRGRLLGLMYAVFLDDRRLRVLLDQTPAADFIEHFDRYVLADDVEFEDHSVTHHVFTVYGPRLTQSLGQAALHPSRGNERAVCDDVGLWPTHRAAVPSLELVVPSGAAPRVWKALISAGFVAIGAQCEDVLRVEAGRVSMTQDVPPKALAHELALRDRILSFEKGCYVGQETINRLDVRGQARKHLAGIISTSPLESGATVRVGDADVGVVASCAVSPRFGHVALAIVRRPHDEGAEAHIGDSPVRIVPVPFATSDHPFPLG